MMGSVWLPIDDVSGTSIDFDRAADFLELSAFFADASTVLVSDLVSQPDIGAEEDPADLDEELGSGEEDLVTITVDRIRGRQETLGSCAYPFLLDAEDEVLTCVLTRGSFGHAAYILSLVLSNLRSLSPVLDASGLHPDEQEVTRLRGFFQYFATAALASELQGSAWSFGFPRPDGAPFLHKLRQIWLTLGDGSVEPQPGAPRQPKDDKVDVFAARPHPDGLPGFPLAAAQVATGANVREKSLKVHLRAFTRRWFAPEPATEILAYMIMPFAIADDQFLDDVRTLGNVLHRLRVPRRVAEAAQLVEAGEMIEGYDRLDEAARWVADYQRRARAMA